MSNLSTRPPSTCLTQWVLASLSGLLVCLLACGTDNQPCTSCPPIEGSYALTFAAPTSPDDCQAMGITLSNGVLQLTRLGAVLNATFSRGDALEGTLYDTSDFTLTGTGNGAGGNLDSVSIRGTYHPPLNTGDMPTVDGLWFESHQRSSPTGTQSCTLQRAFTGTRQ